MKCFDHAWLVVTLALVASGCGENNHSAAAHAYWLAQAPRLVAASAPMPVPAPAAAPVAVTAPVVSDAELDTFEERLREVCSTVEPSARTACLKRVARAGFAPLTGAHAAEGARIEAAWQRFSQELCVVDAVAVAFMAPGYRTYGERECQLLQTPRGAYLLSSWANREVNAFHRHILARRRWSLQADLGFSRVTALLQTRPCLDSSFDGQNCSFRLPTATWARARSAAKKLLPARHELARTLCSAWPGLDDTTLTCTELLEMHLLSYAQGLGAPETRRQADRAHMGTQP